MASLAGVSRWLLTANVASAANATNSANSGFTPRTFDPSSLATIKSEMAGRPFIVAFWSTQCEPCRHEMPVWRAMSKAHPGMRIVLVAADPPSQWSQAGKFLRRYRPGKVDVWAFGDDPEEHIRYSVDPRWRGELPRTFLFDRAHASESIVGVATRAAVEQWMAGLER